MRAYIAGLMSVALCLALTGCGEGNTEEAAVPTEAACAIGKAVPPTELALKSTVEIRKTPNGEKIKNAKASGILEKTIYHSIDNSTTVKQLCAEGDWTEVQITSPDWLTHVKGWAPNSVFRNIERSSDGARVFVEADVHWDKDTTPHKKRIVEEINRISRTEGCSDLDPATVAQSPSKSTPTKKVFFVTCGFTSKPFNVWFEL